MTAKHPADTLWVNNGTEPESLDPGLCAESAGSQLVQNLFAGLVELHPTTLTPTADLAEHWDIDASQTHYTFYLRNSAWSDGRAVSAQDFVYSWRRMLAPQTASRNASMLFVLRDAQAFNAGWLLAEEKLAPHALRQALQARLQNVSVALHPRANSLSTWIELTSQMGPVGIEAARQALLAEPLAVGQQTVRLRCAQSADVGVHAVDARTLSVHLERPVAYFMSLLAHTSLRPVPKHVFEALAAAQLPEALWTRPEHIVSNGPYKLSQWRFRRDMSLTKNPAYWDAAHVALTHIKVLQIEHAPTALNLYRTGDLDWLGANSALPSAYIETLRQYADFHQERMLGVYFYWFNTKVKPLDDVRVRRALSLAVDREALVRRILQGGQMPTASLVPDGVSGYRAVDTPLTDIAQAQTLLAQAGYPDGKNFPTLTLVYNTADEHKQIAETLQAMWSEHLGVHVALENQEWRVLLQRVQAGQFDLARMGWAGDYPDANTFLYDVLSEQSGNNLSGLHNPAFEAKLAEANRCAQNATRQTLLRDAEALALLEQPLMPLFVSSLSTLVKPYVRGFSNNNLGYHSYKYLFIDPPAPSAQHSDRLP